MVQALIAAGKWISMNIAVMDHQQQALATLPHVALEDAVTVILAGRLAIVFQELSTVICEQMLTAYNVAHIPIVNCVVHLHQHMHQSATYVQLSAQKNAQLVIAAHWISQSAQRVSQPTGHKSLTTRKEHTARITVQLDLPIVSPHVLHLHLQ